MSYHLLGDTPNQNMCEAGESVRCRNDEIDTVILCKGADINNRRPIRKYRCKFDGAEVHRSHKLAHFALSSFPSSFLQAGNIVKGSAFCGIDVSEISGMQQNDLRTKLVRERNRVTKTFP